MDKSHPAQSAQPINMKSVETADGASGFHIVEYSPVHAASLADMWNRSAANWGGANTIHTEASILEEHIGSINITEFLALDNQEAVIGFCSFSRYARDHGALYIPLLNVRPDWHGRKVGKALVLAAVRRTAEMGWPRLDLYTWPGNTKAVPTYKKCGFFWERRDDTTHLMNFIPTVLTTAWLQPFFKTADWYADAVREIEVAPDGREEHGFHLYEYTWMHNGVTAKAGFERTGRSLCLVETDTFHVSMALEAQKVVANQRSPFRVLVRNKGDEALLVSIRGVDDGPLHTVAHQEMTITGEAVLEGTFLPAPLPQPQNLMQTHPRVSVEVRVNGIPVTLQMGVEIRPPALLKAHAAHVPALPGMHREGFVDIENCFSEPAMFKFRLPETAVLTPLTDAFSIRLSAGEKRSLPFPHHIGMNGYWQVSVPITATLDTGASIAFEAPLRLLAGGWRGRFSGEDDDGWFMVNGPFTWRLQKDGGGGTITSHGHDESATWFHCPSLGKPYSNEFKTLPAKRVEHFPEAECMVQQAEFASTDFPGLTVIATTRLWAHGELEHALTVRNDSDTPHARPVFLTEGVWHDLRRAVLPYDGTYLEITEEVEQDYDLYDAARLTENWIFSRGEQFTRGLCWASGQKPVLHNGLAFEHAIGDMPAGAVWQAPPLRMACGFFDRWQDFRHYAQPRPEPVRLAAQRMLTCVINDGNPFLPAGSASADENGDRIEIRFEQHMKSQLDGTLEAVWVEPGDTAVQTEHTESCADTRQNPQLVSRLARNCLAVSGEDATSFRFAMPPPDRSPALLRLSVRNSDSSLTLFRCVFPTSTDSIRRSETIRNGCRVLALDNGTLAIGASPDFSHALMSLRVNGREWLDTSFPTPGPRSWWGSWPGGISTIPWDLQHATAHHAGREVSHATLTDTLGNVWEGLSATLTVGTHPRLGGLTLTTWYLLLPGAPVLAIVTRVCNGTGRWLNDEPLGCQCFFKPAPALPACWFESKDHGGAFRRFRGGLTRIDISSPEGIILGMDNAEDRLQPVVDTRHGAQMGIANTETLGWIKTLCVTAADGAEAFTDPVFLIATTEGLPAEALMDLGKIRFQ